MGGVDYENRYAELYDDQAAQYDSERFGSRKGRFDADYKNALVLDVLRCRGLLVPGKRIVDLAAGTGRITQELARQPVEQVIAVDISAQMLAANERALAPSRRDRVEYRVMSMKAMNFPDASLDAATLGSFFYLLPAAEYPHYVREIHRVLKPGGVLVAEVSNALMLLNPRNFLQVLVHRHVRKKPVTSHVYPWEMARLFKPFEVDEMFGVTYPVVTHSYERYARYSAALGRSPLLRHVGGKSTVVLRRP